MTLKIARMPQRLSLGSSASETEKVSHEHLAKMQQAKLSLGCQIRYVYRAFVKALAEELGPHRVTTSQWSALRFLWQDEGLSQVELAQRMMVERASLTPVLAAMEAGSLITRSRNPDDNRKIIIFLTVAGRQLTMMPIGVG